MFAEIKTRICVSSTTVHVDTDDACAITVVVTRVRRMREGAATRLRTRLRKDGQTNVGRKGGRERRWRSREGARERERECSGRQGFVSLSVGNQVNGPVGRPLSISVLLAAYNAPRVVISRSLFLSSYLLAPSFSTATISSCSFLPPRDRVLRRSHTYTHMHTLSFSIYLSIYLVIYLVKLLSTSPSFLSTSLCLS